MNTLITALATPYKEGKIDKRSYERLVAYQLDEGVDALLAVGTTAEAQLLTKKEKRELLTITKNMANKTPVWAGVSGRSTTEAMHEAVFAEELGADGLLIAPPSFVKCTPQGYLMYVKEILKVVTVPVMLYNAPSRTNYTLDIDAVRELSKQVRYLKDAGKNLAYTATLSSKLKVLCGNDLLLPDMLANGACGVVSVVSNVAPALTRRILNGTQPSLASAFNSEVASTKAYCKNCKRQEYADPGDYRLFEQLSKLSMLEVSPIAVKYMLYKKGIFASYNMRLPLTRANDQTQRKINKLWLEYSEKDSPLR